jgi:hypothetical protein
MAGSIGGGTPKSASRRAGAGGDELEEAERENGLIENGML